MWVATDLLGQACLTAFLRAILKYKEKRFSLFIFSAVSKQGQMKEQGATFFENGIASGGPFPIFKLWNIKEASSSSV